MASRRKHTGKEIEAYFALLDSIRDKDGLQLELPLNGRKDENGKPRHGPPRRRR